MEISPRSGQFRILYFANVSTITGKTEEKIQAPIAVSALFNLLEERYPGIRSKVLDYCAVTINLEYVETKCIAGFSMKTEGTIIKDGDEVAIIPPVSSG